MERRFDAIVLLPLSLVVGFAAGVYVVSGDIPITLISQTATILLAAFIAMIMIELLIRTISDGVLSAMHYDSDAERDDSSEERAGERGELTVLLLRKGAVVGQMNSWEIPLPKKKRDYWLKKLARIWWSRPPAAGAEPK